MQGSWLLLQACRLEAKADLLRPSNEVSLSCLGRTTPCPPAHQAGEGEGRDCS